MPSSSAPMPRVLWFNTAILLASSATIVVARKKLQGGEHEAFQSWWWVTTGLGLLFLAGQIIAWRQLAAAGRRVVAIDMRGQYETPGPDDRDSYQLEALGADIGAVATAILTDPGEPADYGLHLLGHRGDRVLLGHVAHHRQRIASRGFDKFHGLPPVGHVDDGDMHAVPCEPLGECLSDALGAAGDDGDLILVPFAHEIFL